MIPDLLQVFADWMTYTVLGMTAGSPLASSVNFFIYDSIKVTALLAVIVFFVGVIRTFITPAKVKKWVGGRTEGVGNVLAALLGIPDAVLLLFGSSRFLSGSWNPACRSGSRSRS